MVDINDKGFAFGKNESLCLKGLLCLLVLMHHLYQFTGYFANTHVGYLLNFAGPWAVTVFIFISGYGLMVSVRNKEDYVNDFLKRRFLPLYLKYVVFVIIYAIYDFEFKLSYVKLIATSLTWGNTVVSFGWFFPMIFALYLGFYFSFKYVRTFNVRCICFIAYMAIYILIAWRFGQNYFPIPSFAVGCAMGLYNEKIIRVFARFKYLIMLLSVALIVAFFICVYIWGVVQQRYKIGNEVYTLFLSLSGIGVCIFAFTFSATCCEESFNILNNSLFGFLGKYSLEVYCLQGLVLRVLYKLISSRILYLVVSVTVTICGAILLNHCFSFFSPDTKSKMQSES